MSHITIQDCAAILQLSGNTPVERDSLIMAVITGVNSCAHCFRRLVGIASNTYISLAEVLITLPTSVRVAG